jgi:hypothetical protein
MQDLVIFHSPDNTSTRGKPDVGMADMTSRTDGTMAAVASSKQVAAASAGSRGAAGDEHVAGQISEMEEAPGVKCKVVVSSNDVVSALFWVLMWVLPGSFLTYVQVLVDDATIFLVACLFVTTWSYLEILKDPHNLVIGAPGCFRHTTHHCMCEMYAVPDLKG